MPRQIAIGAVIGFAITVLVLAVIGTRNPPAPAPAAQVSGAAGGLAGPMQVSEDGGLVPARLRRIPMAPMMRARLQARLQLPDGGIPVVTQANGPDGG